jgi:haloacetate dehalogenase
VGFTGFVAERHAVGDAEYAVFEGGAGEAVLLLHGFPETHECWWHVAPALATSHRVIAVDLRGYGASSAPAGGPRGEGYSKREMAAELVALMAARGCQSFTVVGHDRGARVAFRMALDHPHVVTHLVVINIVPTIDQFDRMGGGPSLGYWPWFLLAQPAPLPERLLVADPDAVLEHAFDTWASSPAAMDGERRAAYRAAMTPGTVEAMCGDYRASFHLDRDHDAADRDAGHRIAAPTLVVTGADEAQLEDAAAVWHRWVVDPTVVSVPGGHFVPEESPEELLAELQRFLGA